MKWLRLIGCCVLIAVFVEGLSTAADSPNLALARQLNEAFVEVAETVMPSVVVINVRQRVVYSALSERDTEDSPGSQSEFWRRFHERMQEAEETIGQGSGIIINEDGYILTNFHVVEDADDVTVRLKDGRTFKAIIRGSDRQSDVAVIKVDAKDLPAAKLADSSKTRVGEFAIAIGAPFNLDYSVTFGHVSAIDRSDVIPIFFGGGIMDQDFIQTDASINVGNSGGPLVNINGEVIGINTMIRGVSTGVGFAVPSNLAREVADQLITSGKFTRAWLGVSIRSLREDRNYRELIKDFDDGVVVSAILPDGPASESGLEAGDVILAVDGKPVATPQDLRNQIRGKRVGRAVALRVVRAGKVIQIKVKPGEWITEKPATIARAGESKSDANAAEIGITIEALTPDLVAKLKSDAKRGVAVSKVELKSVAARNGIRPGDIITAIDYEPVTTPQEYQQAMANTDLRAGIIVHLVSGRTARFEILKQPGALAD